MLSKGPASACVAATVVRRSLAIACSCAGYCSQVSEACTIAEADRYKHSGCHGRHERKIVRQLEQVGNRQGESNIAIKREFCSSQQRACARQSPAKVF